MGGGGHGGERGRGEGRHRGSQGEKEIGEEELKKEGNS